MSEDIAKVALIDDYWDSVVMLRSWIFLSAAEDEGLFEYRPCGEEERVFLVADSKSIFMYKKFFTHLHL